MSYNDDITLDLFRLRVVNEERTSSELTNILLSTRWMLKWTAGLRERRIPDLSIVSLEPFIGGLLGLYVARRARGIFVCEVNGVYADQNNIASGGIPGLLRRAARRVLGAFVL